MEAQNLAAQTFRHVPTYRSEISVTGPTQGALKSFMEVQITVLQLSDLDKKDGTWATM